MKKIPAEELEVDPQEVADYLARVAALSHEIMPGVFEFNMHSQAPGPDPRIIVDLENNTITLHYRYPYEIDLDRVKSHKDLVSWMVHLCEKNWMNTMILREFAERVGEEIGRAHV